MSIASEVLCKYRPHPTQSSKLATNAVPKSGFHENQNWSSESKYPNAFVAFHFFSGSDQRLRIMLCTSKILPNSKSDTGLFFPITSYDVWSILNTSECLSNNSGHTWTNLTISTFLSFSTDMRNLLDSSGFLCDKSGAIWLFLRVFMFLGSCIAHVSEFLPNNFSNFRSLLNLTVVMLDVIYKHKRKETSMRYVSIGEGALNFFW